MLELVRKALEFLDRRQRRGWLLLIPLTLLVAGLEATGAGLIFALIRLVDDSAAVAHDGLLSRLQGAAGWVDDEHRVAFFGLLVAVFYLVKNALRLYETYVRQRCAAAAVTAIGGQLLHRYLAAPYSFHLRRNSATLIRDVHGSAEVAARGVLQSATLLASHVLVSIGILVVVVAAAPGPTLAAAAVVGGATFGLFALTARRVTAWGVRVNELRAAVLQSLQQSLGGVKELKVLGRGAAFEAVFVDARNALARKEINRSTLGVAPHILVESLFVCGLALLIVVVQAQGSGSLVPLLGLFAYAGFRILPAIRDAVENLSTIRFSGPALDKIHHDWKALASSAGSSSEASGPPLAFGDRITFDGVSYAYPETRGPALDRVSFAIRRGESVGIVGPTGAGKSTLVDLLLGLLPPSEGRIGVDGKDIREHVPEWQRQIGYVPQSIFLTDDAIRRNIALGLEDSQIDEARVRAALRMARLEDFVASLPRGLDTTVGERGVRLSGGERQRIGIARALYRNPEVLVFDEATASLDQETERQLAREIESLQGAKTLIVIAHRSSTVRQCDRLIFLEDGRVVDIGPYEELLTRSARFRQLVAATAAPPAAAGEATGSAISKAG